MRSHRRLVLAGRAMWCEQALWLFEVALVLVRLDSVPLKCFSASFRAISSQALRTTCVSKERKMEIHENEKRPCSVKINSDPYAKRTTGRVAATPAR